MTHTDSRRAFPAGAVEDLAKALLQARERFARRVQPACDFKFTDSTERLLNEREARRR